MSWEAGGWWPYVVILVAGILATDVWRVLGVFTARKLDESSELLRWVRAVSTALVAGLVARIVLLPVGAMAATPMAGRIAAVGIGFAVFAALRRNVLAGILVAEALLIASTWLTLNGG